MNNLTEPPSGKPEITTPEPGPCMFLNHCENRIDGLNQQIKRIEELMLFYSKYKESLPPAVISSLESSVYFSHTVKI